MSRSMPFNGMRYAHKAIRAEVTALESAAARLVAASGEEVGEFADRVQFFRVLTRGHTDGEEEYLWPVLEAKYPEISVPYTLDHRAEHELFASLDRALSDFRSSASQEERERLGREMARLTATLSVMLIHHSRKEDAHIIPVTERSVSMEEQERISAQSVKHIPREIVPRAIPFVAGALTLDEREDYVRLMRAGQPPEVFEQGTVKWLRAGLADEDWSALVGRIPELAELSSQRSRDVL